MIKLVITLLTLTQPQPDSLLQLKALDTVYHKADFITTDPIGNLYAIKGSTINKYNAKGDSVTSQNFNALRNIEFLDASQAMKLYALNYSFNTLVILDNTLSTQNEPIRFDKLPIEQVSLLCASNFNNTVWLYDAVNMQVIKTDQNFRVINSSVNFYSHESLSGIPNYMMENNNNLYLNIPGNGIKVFNQQCNFIQSLPVKTEGKFIVRNQKVYYLENGLIHFYNIIDFTFGQIDTGITAEDFSIEKNMLFIKQADRIYYIGAEYDF